MGDEPGEPASGLDNLKSALGGMLSAPRPVLHLNLAAAGDGAYQPGRGVAEPGQGAGGQADLSGGEIEVVIDITLGEWG